MKQLSSINPNIVVLSQYTNNTTKVTCQCLLDSYVWEATPNNLLRNHGCPKCSRHVSRTQEDFEQEANQKNHKITVIGQLINTYTPILVRCNKCAREWKMLPTNILKGVGCRVCSGLMRKTQSEFEDAIKHALPNVRVVSRYINLSTKMTFFCEVCQKEFQQWPQGALKGIGCSRCGHHRGGMSLRRTHAEFLASLQAINPNVEVLSSYIKSNQKILVQCTKCGHKYRITPNGLLVGHQCPACSSNSRGEDKINQWLIDNKIVFRRQHTFADCKDKRALRFDFYLPDYKACIEYDGKQHFVETSFGGKSDLSNIQRRDAIKNKYCQTHKIPLLRIPYTEFSHIEDLLEKFKQQDPNSLAMTATP